MSVAEEGDSSGDEQIVPFRELAMRDGIPYTVDFE